MLEELEELIEFIKEEHIEFNKRWKQTDYFSRINLSRINVRDLIDSELILNTIFDYREFINENNIKLLMDFKQFNTKKAKVNARVKNRNSIEYKIKNYIENH